MQVVVEPGVVLDQLNVYLASHGLFFPPDVSSSSRATVGGMVATDASGKGSRIYGKTSNYINTMDVVLSDGSDYCVKALPQLDIKNVENSLAKQVQQTVYKVITQNRDEINKIFPKMNRGLTGYNLEHVMASDELNDKPNDAFSLSYLLAGSEGTLALMKRLTLRVIAKPKVRALVVVLYKDFDCTLEHIPHLLKADPIAIEVLDDKILEIAQQDLIWQDVEASFNHIDLTEGIKGLNFIEVSGESIREVEQQSDVLLAIINSTRTEFNVMASLVETDSKVISSLWGIRKRAVGLLGALEGSRQPTAFVEDTAVPPENLPAFIKDFRAILDSHGLSYGMYGHADVGCLHVRPALDMRQQTDQKLLRAISDQVVELTRKYGGLLWGEHGRGYRGEYSPLFFGKKLYPLLEEIKASFDPYNLFNPGKLAAPSGNKTGVIAIDEPLFRGSFDAQMTKEQAQNYQTALRCNGNGACFSWDKSEAMCPSYKTTKDKRYSPKGRAAMLREWLRLSNTLKANDEKLISLEDELFQSLNACLSCKSCTHSCPIKVDIPELKSQFLQSYYQTRKRPMADYAFAYFEKFANMGRMAPDWANVFFQNKISSKLLAKVTGVINPPSFSVSLKTALKQQLHQAIFITAQNADALMASIDKSRAVILLPDSFNASYNTKVLLAAYNVMSSLGCCVYIAPITPSGKALHVKGFRDDFKKVAKYHVQQMEALAKTELPLISVEVVTRLMHQKEYANILKEEPKYHVISIESWLFKHLENLASTKIKSPEMQNELSQVYTLLPHCMEQTADKQSSANWQKIFDALGVQLLVKASGCCGMSGLFGHEKANEALSKKIYQENWRENVENASHLLATGFSCRCQLDNHKQAVKHPIEILSELLTKNI